MAFINTTVYSNVLAQNMHLGLFLPNDRMDKELRKPHGLIYFLHGMGTNEQEFREYTAANRYARENHIAIAYVSAPQSFYTNMKYGMDYCTYLTTELPAILEHLFGLSFPKKRTFIAGLSMGGYGALKIGMSNPDKFGACAGFSAPCDLQWALDNIDGEEKNSIFIPIFGEELKLEQHQDLFKIAQNMASLPKEEQTRVFMACGKQDDLYKMHDQNTKFKTFMETLDLDSFKYMEWDGHHNYTFWDRAMLHATAFFMKNSYDKRKIEYWRCD